MCSVVVVPQPLHDQSTQAFLDEVRPRAEKSAEKSAEKIAERPSDQRVLLVSLSGGVDSMVLTHALLALRSAHKASYEATAAVVLLVVVVARVVLTLWC